MNSSKRYDRGCIEKWVLIYQLCLNVSFNIWAFFKIIDNMCTLFTVLPDSKGCINNILYHHTPVKIDETLIQEGIFENFLKSLNETGVKPKISVISTYTSTEEKEFLEAEIKIWETYVDKLDYIEVQTSHDFLSLPPYAQDMCIVLNAPYPSIIMTKSDRCIKYSDVLHATEELIKRAGFKVQTFDIKYNLEGGYLLSTSNNIFYSHQDDDQIVKQIKQKSFFIYDLLNDMLKKIFRELYISSTTIDELPTHIDTIFSFLERDELIDVFYVDFRENTLSNPSLTHEQFISLGTIFNEWDQSIDKLCKLIAGEMKNTRFHKIPGIINFEYIPAIRNGIYGTIMLPYLYSGVNLLFHSVNNIDYAFYLKFPSDIEYSKSLELNNEIQETLKSVDIKAIPISGNYEITNLNHIRNSAGLRCLIKVLSRNGTD